LYGQEYINVTAVPSNSASFSFVKLSNTSQIFLNTSGGNALDVVDVYSQLQVGQHNSSSTCSRSKSQIKAGNDELELDELKLLLLELLLELDLLELLDDLLLLEDDELILLLELLDELDLLLDELELLLELLNELELLLDLLDELEELEENFKTISPSITTPHEVDDELELDVELEDDDKLHWASSLDTH